MHDLCSSYKHNAKICIICTGVVWLALPATIATLSIRDIYAKHIKLTQSKRTLAFYCLLYYIHKHTGSIMVLTFENGNYILTYKGHLENKIAIKI